ncbi:MAG: SusD/RagB family nutrient-binding outer membrane lipoprotein [Bacteroidota bacterium]|nr:SusD/RagB family nutrient-binding outer membrane lipoprotein [Bacteroidota bacterium]
MMKTINKYTLSLFLMVFVILSCTDGFEELNIDPNNPTEVPAENLFTEAQFRLADRIWGRALNFDFGMLMVQHFSLNEYAERSRYNLINNNFNVPWQSFYSGILQDLNEARRITEENQTISDNERANRLAQIQILRVYSFQMITDIWGDVPYSQALQPDEFPSPEYDSQENIYNGLVNEINNALGMITPAEAGFGSGDIIFGGDMAMWAKFGNSVKLKLGMRMADVAPGQSATVVSEALNSGLGVISSLEENAEFTFDADQRIANPFFVDQVTRDDFAISEILVTRMSANDDPRLNRYALPNANNQIVGIPYGLTDPETFLLKASSSRPHGAIREATAPAILLSYSEVEFFRTEAIERGFVTGNAQEAFNNAVTASMMQWDLTEADASAYLAANPYNGGNWRQSIGYEKWVSLYTQGLEAWFERRRLNEPDLPVPAAAVQNQIPVRALYPGVEAEANAANLNQVGVNDMTTRVWWDVN